MATNQKKTNRKKCRDLKEMTSFDENTFDDMVTFLNKEKKGKREKNRGDKEKKLDKSLKPIYHGIVKNWKDNGYGFITWNGENEEEDVPQDIFFHISQVTNYTGKKGSWLSNSPGRKCTFNLGFSESWTGKIKRKLEAKNVFIH